MPERPKRRARHAVIVDGLGVGLVTLEVRRGGVKEQQVDLRTLTSTGPNPGGHATVHRPHFMLDLLVFLCHSNKDKPAVRKLDRRLRKDGIQTWFDETALTGGEEWEPAIVKAVRRSDIVIVCLSQSAVTGSGYLQKELRTVLDVADEQPQESRFIMPVKLEDCDVPGRLAKWQWIDHYKRGGYPSLLAAT